MAADTYHHGNLREELIQKGLHLLAREGYDGFSMRKLANLCGVSHAAPYKHFPDKEALIFAISGRIGEEFSGSLRNAVEANEGDVKAQFTGIACAYVRFLTENPDYFRFVFMVDHNHPIDLENTALPDTNPLAIAFSASKRYFNAYHREGEDPLRFFLAFWSLVHGYTLLLVNHTVSIRGDHQATLRSMLERLLGDNTEG